MPAGALAYRRVSNGCFARVMGLPRWRAQHRRREEVAERYGVLPGSINPNLFQDQEYKFGSLEIRILRCVNVHCNTLRTALRLRAACIAETFLCGSRTVRTTLDGKYPTAQGVVHGGAEGVPCRVIF